MAFSSFWEAVCLLISILTILPRAMAQQSEGHITYSDSANNVIYLADNRRPSLYTQGFGDCLGTAKSAINIDRFDASFYRDNMTVQFHIQGSSNLTRENVMMFLGVHAYGNNYFEQIFNPCGTNLKGLCPVTDTNRIEAQGTIPLGEVDVAGIPPIAFSIPDFEGQAILRIFSNTTRAEIACYSAVITNGATFKHNAAIGTVLGIFALVAIVGSIATAIYGDNIPKMRTHHAHSMSVLVVFAVYQHIYLTGALSMNWPSVLVAWMSNFAWSCGMIPVNSIQDAISQLHGRSSSEFAMVVSGARSGADSSADVAGGFDLSKIYTNGAPRLAKRIFDSNESPSPVFASAIRKRDLANATTGYRWYGGRVRENLPLPGNYSGFAGTLSLQGIPVSNAFITGLIWFVILLGIVTFSIVVTKLIFDLLITKKTIKSTRFRIFLQNWAKYLAAALLKTCFIGFFPMMFLSIFQFTYRGAVVAIAVAAIVFVALFVGMFATVGMALHKGLGQGTWRFENDRLMIEKVKVLKFLPWFRIYSGSSVAGSQKVFVSSLPWKRLSRHPGPDQLSPHEDEDFIEQYGWLASRYRVSQWWFFSFWLAYEFVRACFYAGASGYPLVQVFGLLIVEFIAFVIIVRCRPYEGQRLNVVMVWLLGLSKVVTVALSAAFHTRFSIARIPATAIGVVIIVVQGLLVVSLLCCILLGAISSYFTLTQNRESIKPRRWIPYRQRYFAHIEQRATDIPNQALLEEKVIAPEHPLTPSFSVSRVRRMAKIEDEDAEFQKEIAEDPRDISRLSLGGNAYYPAESSTDALAKRRASTLSIASTSSQSSIPASAKIHRAYWSTKELGDYLEYKDHSTDRFQGHKSTFGSNEHVVPSPSPPPRNLSDDTTVGTASINRRSPVSHLQQEENRPPTPTRSASPRIARTPPRSPIIGVPSSPARNRYSRNSNPRFRDSINEDTVWNA